MVLVLHGHPRSSCTLRVALVLHEKKVPFEFVPVDLPNGEHKSAAYLEKQPFGQIPYIDDDGFILYESRAIGRYIATKYADQGTPLIPKDPKALALFEQAASTEAFNFEPFAAGMATEKIYKVYKGQTTDEAAYAQHNTTLAAKLDAYERILSKQKYLAGDEVTLADLFHVPHGILVPATGSDVLLNDARPNVKRYVFDSSYFSEAEPGR
ncbi:hypothetical protein AX16_007787 [Volvariella volvacea WC 439]|nr:hypothetical protein AX16_007787 [Volvariella volvacea WC 439]